MVHGGPHHLEDQLALAGLAAQHISNHSYLERKVNSSREELARAREVSTRRASALDPSLTHALPRAGTAGAGPGANAVRHPFQGPLRATPFSEGRPRGPA